MNHPSRHKDEEKDDDYFSEAEEVNDYDSDNGDKEGKKEKTVKIKQIVRKPQPKLDPMRYFEFHLIYIFKINLIIKWQ
jgi:hypothetical protein